MAESKAKAPAAAPAEPEKKMVKIKLPRPGKNEESHEFVSVNQRTWQVQKGVEVEVPECVAKIFELRDRQMEEAYEFEREVQK